MEQAQTKRMGVQHVIGSEFTAIPRVGPLQAVRRYWVLALLPIIILVPILGFVASRTKPTYSAESRMIVGQLNISAPGAIEGYAQAAQDLAATYPLVIDADSVVNPTAAAAHVTPAYVRAHLSATQVPASSIVRIDGTGSSAAQAIAITNTASKALVTYLAKVNSNPNGLKVLLTQLRRAELSYHAAKAKEPTQLKARVSPQGQRQIAEADTAQVRLNAAVQSYQQNVEQQSLTALLQPISYAAGATNNRRSTLEIALLGALLVGAILGIGLATLRANLVLRRSLTLPTWDPPSDWPSERHANGAQDAGERAPDGLGPPKRP